MIKCQELLLTYSCLNKARPDEPLFVLRAKDPLAAQTIRHWATMASGLHEDDKVSEALKTADIMDEYHQRTCVPGQTPIQAPTNSANHSLRPR
jgi:hypothetical protein